MPRRMWKTVEAKAGKVRVAKAKGRGKEERNRKEMRRKRRKIIEGKEKERKMEVIKIAEECKIWDKEEKAAKLEVEIRKLISEKFHK